MWRAASWMATKTLRKLTASVLVEVCHAEMFQRPDGQHAGTTHQNVESTISFDGGVDGGFERVH